MVEYALLLTFFAVPVCGGMTLAGAKMLENYKKARTTLLSPFP